MEPVGAQLWIAESRQVRIIGWNRDRGTLETLETLDQAGVWCIRRVGQGVWTGGSEAMVAWSLEGEQLQRVSVRSGAGIRALYWSPAEGQVWSGDQAGAVVVWGAREVEPRQRLETGKPIRTMVMVGQEVWIGGEEGLRVLKPAEEMQEAPFLKAKRIESDQTRNHHKLCD